MLPPVLLLLLFSVSGFREPLTWPAPSPDDPVKTIDVPAAGGSWWGVSTGMDCQVRMPAVPVRAQVKVAGCDDVNIVGGEFKSDADPCSAAAMGDNESPALYLTDFTGTAHIEGILIRGPGFSDGIYMSSTKPNSIGEIEATRIGGLAACAEPASGNIDGWPKEHPDCFQAWAGPATLRFDKVTCSTVYQGLNVDTNNWADALGNRFPASLIDVRRTNVRLDERNPNGRHCYVAWSPFAPAPTRLERVHCAVGNVGSTPVSPTVGANAGWWGGVRFGVPAGGDETAAGEAGIGYRRFVPGEVKVPGTSVPGGNPGGGDKPRSPAVRKAPLLKVLRQGLRLKVRCAEKCLVTARATISGAAARRLGLRSRGARMPVGFARERLSKAGWARVPVHFSKRQRLRRARRLAVRLHVTVASGGHKYSFTRHLKLIRHRT